jgi:hypothetical protein
VAEDEGAAGAEDDLWRDCILLIDASRWGLFLCVVSVGRGSVRVWVHEFNLVVGGLGWSIHSFIYSFIYGQMEWKVLCCVSSRILRTAAAKAASMGAMNHERMMGRMPAMCLIWFAMRFD